VENYTNEILNLNICGVSMIVEKEMAQSKD
jgi:hypothetical protein